MKLNWIKSKNFYETSHERYGYDTLKKVRYSCFEKGCLANGEKLTRKCRKLLWLNAVFTVA